MSKSTVFAVRLPTEWLPLIEEARGEQNRNGWLRSLIERALTEVPRDVVEPVVIRARRFRGLYLGEVEGLRFSAQYKDQVVPTAQKLLGPKAKHWTFRVDWS